MTSDVNYSDVCDGNTWFYCIKGFNDLIESKSEHELKVSARFILDEHKQYDGMDATFFQYVEVCQRLVLIGYKYEHEFPQIKGRFLDNYIKYLNGIK